MLLLQGEKSPLQLALDGRHWNVALLLIKECGASMEEIDLGGRDKVCQCVCSKSVHVLLNALVAHKACVVHGSYHCLLHQ